MHRLIAIAILLFWVIMFGGLAHLSLTGLLDGSNTSEAALQGVFSTVDAPRAMPVLFLVVAALFAWAILALVMLGNDDFRAVEANSYAAAIFLMCACAVLAFANLGVAVATPALLAASLITSVAASRSLLVGNEAEPKVTSSRAVARRMAIGAAHTSLLSHVSGRQIPGNTHAGETLSQHHRLPVSNVTSFPTKPFTGGHI